MKIKVYVVSPGENAQFWSDCYNGKYICIGWLENIDLSSLVSQSDLSSKFQEESGRKIEMNERASIWGFAKDLKVGDLILAKKGNERIVGAGIVTSPYISPYSARNDRTGGTPQSHGHLHRVNWIWSGEISVKGLPIKALTEWEVEIINGIIVERNRDQGARLKKVIAAAGIDLNELHELSMKAVQDSIKEELNMKNEEKKMLLEIQKQIILHGPPGTGKTRLALELARAIVCDPNENDEDFKSKRGSRWNIVQFHPAYNYEDFVRGVRVSTTPDNKVTYITENGIFGKMAATANVETKNAKRENRKARNFVLIIDEINRANLASVLGELIYALEYRGHEVDTPYEIEGGGRSLVVPENLLIIGTMNTADRSIGHIDYAIRRRFAFVPCLPQSSVFDGYYSNNVALRDRATHLFNQVAGLFVKISENGKGRDPAATLSQDFSPDDVQLGHSYFLAESLDELERKIQYQVKPILTEYVRDGVLTAAAQEKINCLAA